MNPLTPPHTTSPSTSTAFTSASNETTYFHPRSYSKHRSSSHFSSSYSSSSSSSSSPEAKRPRASTVTKPTSSSSAAHFPTPALTPEHPPPANSSSATADSRFPPTSSADSIEGPKGFVKRDDLTQKAVAASHAQSHEAVQQIEKDRFVNGLVGEFSVVF